VNSWLGTASGYWSDADNWSAGAPANGDTPVFPAAALHRHNTNDLILPDFPLIRILGGGCEFDGNGMNAERIEAAYSDYVQRENG